MDLDFNAFSIEVKTIAKKLSSSNNEDIQKALEYYATTFKQAVKDELQCMSLMPVWAEAFVLGLLRNSHARSAQREIVLKYIVENFYQADVEDFLFSYLHKATAPERIEVLQALKACKEIKFPKVIFYLENSD